MAQVNLPGRPDLDLRNRKVIGLAEGSIDGDAVRFEQLHDALTRTVNGTGGVVTNVELDEATQRITVTFDDAGSGAGFQRQGTEDVTIPVNGGVVTRDGTRAFVNISAGDLTVTPTETDFTTGWLEVTTADLTDLENRTQHQTGNTNNTTFSGRIVVEPGDLDDALLVSGDSDILDIGIRRTTTTPGKIGSVEFEGATAVRYAEITGNIEDGTDGSEDGSLDVSVMVGGTTRTIGTFDAGGLTLDGDITLTNLNTDGLVDGVDVSGLEFDPLGTASGWTQAIGEVVAWEDGLHSGDPYQGQVDALVRQPISNYNSLVTGGRAFGEVGFTAGQDNEILISNVEQDTLVDWVTSDDTRLAADRIGYVHIIPLEGNPAVYVCRVNTAKTEAALRNFTTGSQTFAAPNTGTNTTYTLTDTFTNIISVQVIGATTINLTPQSEYTVNGQEITILINITDPAAVVTIGYNEQRTVPTAPQNTTGTLWDVVADFSWKAVPSFAQNDDTREVIGITTSSFMVDRDFDETISNVAELVDVRPVLPHIDEDLDLKADIDNIGILEVPSSDEIFESTENYLFADRNEEFTFDFITPDAATFSVDFTVETGFISSFAGSTSTFADSEWVLGYRATDAAPGSAVTEIGRIEQGSHTGSFAGTFTLTEEVTGILQNTAYTFVLTPGVTSVVIGVAPEGYSIRIHENYDGDVRILSGTRQAIIDLGGEDINLSTESIGALSDVDTTTVAPTNGQALVWDNDAEMWEPGNVIPDSTVPTPDPQSAPGSNDSDDVGKYLLVNGAGDYFLPDITFADGVRSLINSEGNSGTVDTSGDPEDGDIAVFTDNNTIEGSTLAELGLETEAQINDSVNDRIEHLTLESLANVTEEDVTGIVSADFALRDNDTAFLSTRGSCNIYLLGDVRSSITIGDRFYPVIGGTVSPDLYTVVDRVALDGANTEVFGAGTSQAFINLVVDANIGGNPFTGFYFLPNTITGWHEETSVTSEGILLIGDGSGEWTTTNNLPSEVTHNGNNIVGIGTLPTTGDQQQIVTYNRSAGVYSTINIPTTGGGNTFNTTIVLATPSQTYFYNRDASYLRRVRIIVDEADSIAESAARYMLYVYAQNLDSGPLGNRDSMEWEGTEINDIAALSILQATGLSLDNAINNAQIIVDNIDNFTTT